MDPFGWKANVCALSVATFLAARATRKRTLSKSGATAGFCVGYLLVATGLRGLLLFFFYQLGSWATKYQKSRKANLDSTVSNHSVRGASQVLCVSALATILSLVHACKYGPERPIDFVKFPYSQSCLTLAVLAHHANSLGDTWASELGMLTTKSIPVLITNPWRHVPPGTNGGITLCGTIWSIIGGCVIGLLFLVVDSISGNLPLDNAQTPHSISIAYMMRIIAYGGTCGFVGSLLDSLLGATVQSTDYDKEMKQVIDKHRIQHQQVKFNNLHCQHVCGRDWLTNEQVNLISLFVTTFIGGYILGPWWFSEFE